MEHWREKKVTEDLKDINELRKCLTGDPETRKWAAAALAELGETNWRDLIHGERDDLTRLEECQDPELSVAAREGIIKSLLEDSGIIAVDAGKGKAAAKLVVSRLQAASPRIREAAIKKLTEVLENPSYFDVVRDTAAIVLTDVGEGGSEQVKKWVDRPIKNGKTLNQVVKVLGPPDIGMDIMGAYLATWSRPEGVWQLEFRNEVVSNVKRRPDTP